MIKNLFAVLALGTTFVANAEQFPYLAFECADGTVHSVNTSNLDAVFSDGTMVVTHSEGVLNIPVSNLSKFYFTSIPSGIDNLPVVNTAVSVYNTTGMAIGNFEDLKSAKQALPAGIYVIKSESETFKIAVK